MRIQAELPQRVQNELAEFTRVDQDDFFRKLWTVCENPLVCSEALVEPGLSRYVLRWFAFGSGRMKVAIFAFDGQTVRVMKCRLSRFNLRGRSAKGQNLPE